jgi:hypothetical protein
MHDLNCVVLDDAVEDLVTIAPHHLHADLRIIRALRGIGPFGYDVNSGVDGTQDIPGAAWISLF